MGTRNVKYGQLDSAVVLLHPVTFCEHTPLVVSKLAIIMVFGQPGVVHVCDHKNRFVQIWNVLKLVAVLDPGGI